MNSSLFLAAGQMVDHPIDDPVGGRGAGGDADAAVGSISIAASSSAVSMWKAGFPWSFASSARRRVFALFRPPTMNTASVPAASA